MIAFLYKYGCSLKRPLETQSILYWSNDVYTGFRYKILLFFEKEPLEVTASLPAAFHFLGKDTVDVSPKVIWQLWSHLIE